MFSHFAQSRLVSRATKVMIICLAVLWNGQLLAETDKAETDEGLSKDCMDKAVNGAYSDMLQCDGEELDRQDARLNDAYKKLMSELSPDRKKALLKAQRVWIKFREANCDYWADPDATFEGRANTIGCLLRMTVGRVKELEGMLEAPQR